MIFSNILPNDRLEAAQTEDTQRKIDIIGNKNICPRINANGREKKEKRK